MSGQTPVPKSALHQHLHRATTDHAWLPLSGLPSRQTLVQGLPQTPLPVQPAPARSSSPAAESTLGQLPAQLLAHLTVFALLNVIISVTVAIPAGYAFSRFRFFGDRILLFGFLAFRMMAPAILLIPFVEIFSRLNMIDTYSAVALVHCFFNVPLAIWILEGFI